MSYGEGDFSSLFRVSPDFIFSIALTKARLIRNTVFSPFPTPAGSGVGVDIGLSAKLKRCSLFGFAVTDIGSITWNKNVAQYFVE